MKKICFILYLLLFFHLLLFSFFEKNHFILGDKEEMVC